MADKDDTLYDDVSAMADRIGLEGSDRTKYIHQHMTRGGYKAVPNYVPAEESDDDEEQDEFFGASGKRKRSDSGRSRRSSGSSGRRRNRDDDDDW